MTYLAVAIGAVLVGWLLTRRTHKDTHLPKRPSVHLGLAMVMAGCVVGVLVWPASVTLGLWWVGGYVLLRSASRRALGWVSLGEVVAEAVHCGWVSVPRAVVSSLFAAGGLALTALSGWDHSAVLGTGVALIPTLWWVQSGLIRQAEQQRAETVLAGLFKHGRGWEAMASDLGAAPVQVKTKPDDSISRITAPIPAEWDSAKEEKIELDTQNRLCTEPGERWPVVFDYGQKSGKRRLITRRVPPLPNSLVLTRDLIPDDPHKVFVGQVSISKRAALAGVGEYASQCPLHLDLNLSPHWLVVGETGSGKSVCLTCLIVQLALRGWDIRFIDPKRVEVTPWVGRQGVTRTAVTLGEAAALLTDLVATMDERYALLAAHKVRKVSQLPPEVRETLQPIAAIVDEIVELIVKSAGASEEAKAQNDLKATIMDALDSLIRLGRAADIHVIAACQRADRSIVSGQFQNNLSTVFLFAPAGANATTRTMADLNEVNVTSTAAGRGVVRSIGLPECEVQGAFVDDDALDEWLPVVNQQTLSEPDNLVSLPVEGDPTKSDLREQPGDQDPLSDEDLAALLDGEDDDE